MEYNTPKELQLMHNAAKDIINIKFDGSDKLENIMYKFYEIMRKYGIKQGTKTNGGICTNNFEWTMCLDLFMSQLVSHLNWDRLMSDVPEDLGSY